MIVKFPKLQSCSPETITVDKFHQQTLPVQDLTGYANIIHISKTQISITTYNISVASASTENTSITNTATLRHTKK